WRKASCARVSISQATAPTLAVMLSVTSSNNLVLSRTIALLRSIAGRAARRRWPAAASYARCHSAKEPAAGALRGLRDGCRAACAHLPTGLPGGWRPGSLALRQRIPARLRGRPEQLRLPPIARAGGGALRPR